MRLEATLIPLADRSAPRILTSEAPPPLDVSPELDGVVGYPYDPGVGALATVPHVLRLAPPATGTYGQVRLSPAPLVGRLRSLPPSARTVRAGKPGYCAVCGGPHGRAYLSGRLGGRAWRAHKFCGEWAMSLPRRERLRLDPPSDDARDVPVEPVTDPGEAFAERLEARVGRPPTVEPTVVDVEATLVSDVEATVAVEPPPPRPRGSWWDPRAALASGILTAVALAVLRALGNSDVTAAVGAAMFVGGVALLVDGRLLNAYPTSAKGALAAALVLVALYRLGVL